MLHVSKLIPGKAKYDFSDSRLVGIQLRLHVWHWFYRLPDGTLLFSHSYSQASGKTKKGGYKGTHRFKVEKSIMKKM